MTRKKSNSCPACVRFLWLTVCWIIVIPMHGQVSAEDAESFVPLFNEKDLSGWVLVNTPPETWTVHDGMLVCSGKPIGEIREANGSVGRWGTIWTH